MVQHGIGKGPLMGCHALGLAKLKMPLGIRIVAHVVKGTVMVRAPGCN